MQKVQHLYIIIYLYFIFSIETLLKVCIVVYMQKTFLKHTYFIMFVSVDVYRANCDFRNDIRGNKSRTSTTRRTLIFVAKITYYLFHITYLI